MPCRERKHELSDPSVFLCPWTKPLKGQVVQEALQGQRCRSWGWGLVHRNGKTDLKGRGRGWGGGRSLHVVHKSENQKPCPCPEETTTLTSNLIIGFSCFWTLYNGIIGTVLLCVYRCLFILKFMISSHVLAHSNSMDSTVSICHHLFIYSVTVLSCFCLRNVTEWCSFEHCWPYALISEERNCRVIG